MKNINGWVASSSGNSLRGVIGIYEYVISESTLKLGDFYFDVHDTRNILQRVATVDGATRLNVSNCGDRHFLKVISSNNPSITNHELA